MGVACFWVWFLQVCLVALFYRGKVCGQLKPQRCSSSIKACELDVACGFWDCVQEAALINETEANAYLKEVKVRAKHHVDFSGKVVDRGSAISAVMQSINTVGVLTFVLGGKNLGKSFLKKVAVERCQTDGKI